MAFRLKRRRAIGNELSRIVCREFKKALAQLQRAGTDPEGIHETRKAVKKIRSELRLLHDASGRFTQLETSSFAMSRISCPRCVMLMPPLKLSATCDTSITAWSHHPWDAAS